MINPLQACLGTLIKPFTGIMLCVLGLGLLPASAEAQSPPMGLDWQERQDDRYIVQARNTDLTMISGTKAEAQVDLRLQWWGLMGQPVETYALKWGVSEAFAEEGDLLAPFATKLPNNGDFSGNPEIAAEFAKLRSTDIGMRIEFYIRAPKNAVKGENFYQACDARYCYARGIRDLSRSDLPMGRINRWNSELSPKTPIDYKMAYWQLGCRVAEVECQRNTLRAGTAMAISKMTIWKLTYDTSTAKSIVAKWASAAMADSTQVSQFQGYLQELVQPFQGTNTDPETRAADAYFYYGKQMEYANKLDDQANALDKQVWESGDYSGRKIYAGQLLDAKRKIQAMQKQASADLARARAGTNLSDAQIAELKQLEQDYASQELAVSRADGPVSASGKAELQRALAEKKAALGLARGQLKSSADRIDAKRRGWGAYDEEASYARRASDMAGSLQRDISQINGKLAALDREEKVQAEKLAAASEQRDTDPEKKIASTKVKIGRDQNGRMGVSDANGNVLIPYRDWTIDSFEGGIAQVTIRKQLSRTQRPPPRCPGGGCLYFRSYDCEYEISRLSVDKNGATISVIDRRVERSGC